MSGGKREVTVLSKVVGFAGAAMMAAGVFLPFVKAPVLGAVNYLGDGKGDGLYVLVFAGVSLFALAFNMMKLLWISGTGVAATLAYTFYNFYTNMEAVVRKAGKGGRVFEGMAQSLTDSIVQALDIDIGVPVIVAGILLTFVAAAMPGAKKKKMKLLGGYHG